jgi:hypothetical protein
MSAYMLLGAMLMGCGNSIADISTISFDSASYEIDSYCAEACGGDTMGVTVSLAEDISAGTAASMELKQYKVEYVIDLISDDAVDMPYFAGTLPDGLSAGFGESITLSLPPAGSAQRAWIYTRAGSAPISGTATMHVEVYDHRGQVIELVSEPFSVTFSDMDDADEVSAPDTGLF